MTAQYNHIIRNAMNYYAVSIRTWCELAREPGIPVTVRQARLNRARGVAQDCRVFRSNVGAATAELEARDEYYHEHCKLDAQDEREENES